MGWEKEGTLEFETRIKENIIFQSIELKTWNRKARRTFELLNLRRKKS